MNTNTEMGIVATFTDKFGDDRKVHKTRNGLTVKRRTDTNNQILSRAISGYIGERVRAIRQSKEITMEELGLRAGLTTGSSVKQRVYEIEKNLRSIGIRFATAYQLAIALGVEIGELLPTAETVKLMTGAKLTTAERLEVSKQ